jgi:hypothetical protein
VRRTDQDGTGAAADDDLVRSPEPAPPIYTDGRALPEEFSLLAFLGYSAGHWEHDHNDTRRSPDVHKPFTIKIPHNLMADADIFEDSCDNEKDRAHLGKQ